MVLFMVVEMQRLIQNARVLLEHGTKPSSNEIRVGCSVLILAAKDNRGGSGLSPNPSLGLGIKPNVFIYLVKP
jgi:hypothetical protein